jgi:hypothetical protein
VIGGAWLYIAWVGAVSLILIGLIGLFIGISMLRTARRKDETNPLEHVDELSPKADEARSQPAVEFDTFLVGHKETNEDGSDRQQIIASLSPGDQLRLRHEPRRLDPNAIAVVAQKGVVGFFPAKLARDFLDALADPKNAKVTVGRIVEDNVNGTTVLGVWVRVELWGVPDVSSWWARDGQGARAEEERKTEEIPTDA